MFLIELDAIIFLQSHLASPFMMAFFIFSARWLMLIIALTCLIGYNIEKESNHRHVWKELFWSVGIAFVLNLIISVLVTRIRPFIAFPAQVQAWVPAPATQFSFPSSHSALIWAWAFSATRLSRTGAPLWFLSALLISFSRVVIGVHYPSDVMMGALVGGIGFAYVQWGHTFLRRSSSV